MSFNILLEKLKEQNRPAEDLELIKKAYDFAARAHEGQKRKSGEPFINHPLSTAVKLTEMRLDSKTIAAALLHDTIEDHPEFETELKKIFGEEIAFLVDGVTKLNKIKYKGSQRTAESLRKMFLAIGEDIRIVLLKLVDRTHNMETLQYLPADKQKRIATETLEIYAPLAYRLGMKKLSGQLEDLAFPYVLPERYEWLSKITSDKFPEWTKYMEKIKPVLIMELARDEVKFASITSRIKHLYSLYKKLLKYDLDISKITDIVALRVIVYTLEDCYAALGVVHKLWRPVPGKIRDYIALPKPNGYKSLHTTVFGPEDNMFEVQIRTVEMHQEAEYGIAAHWAYTEFKKERPKDYAERQASFLNQKRFAWLDQIREWQKDVESPDEFLEALKIDFFKARIFVLSPKGDVIDLPEGATPIDFAYHIHTDLGSSATGSKVNGKMVSLDHQLKTGDVVEILIQKGKKPSIDWLKFVKSTQARKKISSVLKKLTESKKFEKKGGEMVEIRLPAKDRFGLLHDVTYVFTKQKINMKNVTTDNKSKSYPAIIIQTVLKNRGELEKIMVRLKEVKGVMEVSYKLL
mgnify:FL=1